MRWLSNRITLSVDDIAWLARKGVLAPRHLARALELARLVPTAAGWRIALARTLLGVGLGMMLAGVICIVAYNWVAMGPLGRFAFGQLVLLAVLALAAFRGFGEPDGQRLLTVAIVLIGPLLALFGQHYQTGADTWELFRSWALLALPWVAASRYAPAWLVWLIIGETALALFLDTFDLWNQHWMGLLPTWLLAAALNVGLLVAWERASLRWAWLGGRAGPRAIAACLLVILSGTTANAVLSNPLSLGAASLMLAPLLWALVLAGGYVVYRVRAVELGMLAMGWLSLTLVLLAWLIRLVDVVGSQTLAFLLGAGLLIGASAWGRRWLTQAAEQRRS